MTPDQKKVIFLDIDGVLQPDWSQQRFRIDRRALQNRLTLELDAGFATLNEYDIAAVQVDWDADAIANLKTICDQTGAQIVVSSSWREGKTLEVLKLLFKIHGLDPLILDTTPQLGGRVLEIEAWLLDHPEVQRFVILDDQYASEFRARFPAEFVLSRGRLEADTTQQALAILSIDSAFDS